MTIAKRLLLNTGLTAAEQYTFVKSGILVRSTEQGAPTDNLAKLAGTSVQSAVTEIWLMPDASCVEVSLQGNYICEPKGGGYGPDWKKKDSTVLSVKNF